MSFTQQVVVVAGATGVVGSGVVRAYLDAGATVVGISRDAGKFQALKERLNIRAGEPFLGVPGDFKDEASAAQVRARVADAVGGRPVDHVISAQGFVTVDKGPTATEASAVRKEFEDGFFTNFLCAKAFLPELKGRAGATFTLVSGGLAHFPPPNPALWLGTVKNAAVNALSFALASETARDAVRVNTVCIHFSVAPVGGDKNQFGMPAEGNSLRLGPAFVGVARGNAKGQLLCLNGWADVDKLRG